MKTYLTIFFSSEGAAPGEVVERLIGMGFRPISCPYDHEHEWEEHGSLRTHPDW